MNRKILAAAFGLMAWAAQAQQVKIQNIKLPDAQVVNAITVDNSNLKWLVSEKGVYKLAAETPEKVNLGAQADVLPASIIMYDNVKQWWIGTYNGKLLKLSQKGEVKEMPLNMPPTAVVSSLATDGSGKIWAATLANGLYLWDEGKASHQHFDKNSAGFPDDRIFKIFTDARGTLWIGTQSGLWSYELDDKPRPSNIKAQVQAIAEHNNSLWVATMNPTKGAELWQYERFTTWKKQTLPQELRNSKIASILFDNQGRCWLAADKIACLESSGWKVYGAAQGYTSVAAICAAIDRENNIWVGTEGKGLFKLGIERPKEQAANNATANNALNANNLNQPIRLNIKFAQSKAELLPESLPELDRIVLLLKENKHIEAEVAGHTDNTGDAKKNIQLSEERAKAVKDYFVQQGIAAKRISTVGYGGARPLADNRDPRLRERNRRVEITLKKTGER